MAQSKANKKTQGTQAVEAAQQRTSKVSKSDKAKKKLNRNGKPKFSVRVKEYFAGVRSELKRVVWPTKDELIKLSLAVVGMLIFFGVLIYLVDLLVLNGLNVFAGLGR